MTARRSAAAVPALAAASGQTLVIEDFPQPDVARVLSPNGRAHWTAKKKAREAVAEIVVLSMLTQRLGAMDGRVPITYRWIVPDQRKRDLDNHSTGVVKVVQDTLVRHELIEADDTSCLVSTTTEIVYQRGRRALEIVLTPVEAL